MATEIKVPALGESVTEATVAKWLKKEGDAIERDEPLCELETEKVTLEVNAPEAGTLSEIRAKEGAEVAVGAVLGVIGEGGGAKAGGEKQEKKGEQPKPAKAEAKPAPGKQEQSREKTEPAADLSPAVRKLVEENDLDPSAMEGSGKDGRLTKGDVLAHIESGGKQQPAQPEAKEAAPKKQREPDERGEERVRMSRLRRAVAARLKEAQNTAAMLTTFNEVDMTGAMELRARYRESFEKKHGVRLGFMSIFVKAAIVALKEFPAVNAEIDGDEIVYKNYYDVGVAVGTEQGLVVPIMRDVDRLGFADIEKKIGELAGAARNGKLTMDDLTGGTFTITNGGIYGSMLSTPILNPPQSGILGMHNIVKRPMVLGDEIKVRPMMYVALSYDHRIVDGREAVSFLVRIKECVEDPDRMLIDM
ncbi:MAG: 2-oxoglutarate dehydrogenase complex dihydrolipoyllysine-residue succinyltransferase [Acetobacterales bacterium]